MGRSRAYALILIGLSLFSLAHASGEGAKAAAQVKSQAAASAQAIVQSMATSNARVKSEAEAKADESEFMKSAAMTKWQTPTPSRIWLDDVYNCRENSYDVLSGCHHTSIGHHNCGHHEDVAICCRHNNNQDCYRGHAYGKKFRVATLNSTGYGRLEFLHAGIWGSVCDDGFNSMSARVACRSAGLPWEAAAWTTITNVLQACNIGRCQHGGYPSSRWRGCHCICTGIWTGEHCEREIQRSCSSLSADIDQLVQAQARVQEVPNNIMQAAFGFSISDFRGVEELTAGVRELQQRQHGTDSCVRWHRSSGFFHQAMIIPQSVSDLTGLDIKHLIMRMRTVNDRMRLLMDVNMMPPMPGQENNAKRVVAQLKQYLGFSGEMPWERNERIRHSQMAAVSNEKEQARRRALELHAKLSAMEEKRGSHKRRIADVQGGIARSEADFMQSDAFQRRAQHVQEEMEDGLTSEAQRVRDHMADLSGVVKKVQDDEIEDIDKHTRVDSIKVQHEANHHAKEFGDDVTKEIKALRHKDRDLVRVVKEPIHRAISALADFYRRRYRLKGEHMRNLTSLRILLKALTTRFRMDTMTRIKAGKRDLQDNAIRMADLYKARTEIKIKRLADVYENFQMNNIRLLSNRQDYMQHVIHGVKMALQEIAMEEYQFLLKTKQKMEEMKARAHTEETHMGQDLENVKARIGVLENEVNSAEAANKATTDADVLALEKEGEKKSTNFEAKIESRGQSIESSQIGKLDHLQDALAQGNTELQGLLSKVVHMEAKSKALESDFEKQRKAVAAVLNDVQGKVLEADARIPTHANLEKDAQLRIEEMNKYCMHLGKSVGENFAQRAAIAEIQKNDFNTQVGAHTMWEQICAKKKHGEQ